MPVEAPVGTAAWESPLRCRDQPQQWDSMEIKDPYGMDLENDMVSFWLLDWHAGKGQRFLQTPWRVIKRDMHMILFLNSRWLFLVVNLAISGTKTPKWRVYLGFFLLNLKKEELHLIQIFEVGKQALRVCSHLRLVASFSVFQGSCLPSLWSDFYSPISSWLQCTWRKKTFKNAHDEIWLR